jgi:GNAT superfamily N-acetyltransferase
VDELIITYLEMRARPTLTVARPYRGVMLLRLEQPTVPFYRYLYDAVGARWGWTARSEISDSELAAIITDPLVEVFVLYVGGVPAGLFELDRRIPGEVELSHYGLAPEFIGRGLGKPLLASAVEAAWASDPERVWARSTNRDHPRGLLVYQWAGFVPYREERVTG